MKKTIFIFFALLLPMLSPVFAQGLGTDETQTNDNHFKGPIPEADATANGAICNGVADDTTALVNTFNSVGATGNEFRIDDNCNLVTPPSPFTTPHYWVTVHLRGRMLTGGTLKLAPLTYIIGDAPQHGPNPFFGLMPMAQIVTSSSSTSPVVDLSVSGNPVGIRNVSIGNGANTGIGLNSSTVNAIIDNISVQSYSNSFQPLVQRGGFGNRYNNSEFAPGEVSTNPAMLIQDNAANGDFSRDTVFKNVFSNYQGARWNSSGPYAYGSCSDGLTFEDYLFENSNNTGNRDALTVDTTNNCKADIAMIRTYVADATNCTFNSGSGSNLLSTVEIIEPIGGGCLKGTTKIYGLFAHTSSFVTPFVGTTPWAGLIEDRVGNTWATNINVVGNSTSPATTSTQLATNATASHTATFPDASGTVAFDLSGTTGRIGGSALMTGNCASGTISVANAMTGMTVSVSPNTYPGDGFIPWGYVSAKGIVTVKLCAQASGTPTASTYNVRVLQ